MWQMKDVNVNVAVLCGVLKLNMRRERQASKLRNCVTCEGQSWSVDYSPAHMTAAWQRQVSRKYQPADLHSKRLIST